MTKIVTISYQNGHYRVYDHYRKRTTICNDINDAMYYAEEMVRYWKWQTRVKGEVVEG